MCKKKVEAKREVKNPYSFLDGKNMLQNVDLDTIIKTAGGIDNIKIEHLTDEVNKNPNFASDLGFMNLYKLVSDNHTNKAMVNSNRVMVNWTWAIGIATALSLIVAILSLCLSKCGG